MSSYFHTRERWSVARALGVLCCGRSADAGHGDIERWLRSEGQSELSVPESSRKALETAFGMVKRIWPADPLGVNLHPIAWFWLGAARFRARVSRGCMAEFVSYIETSLALGQRPMLRRVMGRPSIAGHASSLTDPDGTPVIDLLVATLPLRPFEHEVADQPWRSHFQNNDVPRPRSTQQPREGARRSAESPGCIALVEQLVAAAADRGELVRHASANGGRQFVSLGDKRPAILAKLKALPGGKELGRNYNDSTVMRALSAVVECTPGRARIVG